MVPGILPRPFDPSFLGPVADALIASLHMVAKFRYRPFLRLEEMGLFMEFVVKLTDLEARVAECVGTLIDNEGYELVKIKAGVDAGLGRLSLFIDKKEENSSVTMENLEFLNRLISDVLDVADAEKPFFKRAYNLEVSSPGIERPLTKKSHFEGAINKKIKVRTDGFDTLPKSVTGPLSKVGDEGIDIETIQKEQQTVFVPFDRIRDAYEVFDFNALQKPKNKKGAQKKKSKGVK